jgi:hypothetical protein
VDRGFDGWVMFEDWLDNKHRFVARLVGNRHLLRVYEGSERCEPVQWLATAIEKRLSARS